MVGDVGELLTEPGLGRDAGALLLQPVAEGLDQGRGTRLPHDETPLGKATADVGLNGIELGDSAQPFVRDLRAAAVVDFAKAAPGVGPRTEPWHPTAPAGASPPRPRPLTRQPAIGIPPIARASFRY